MPLIAIAVVVPLLHGCQTDGTRPPTVSLEEAKAVTANFAGTTFTPPPKTIADVTAMLDARPLADPAARRRDRALMNAAPPASASNSKLAVFYRKRGMAAQRLGDASEAIANIKRSVELAQDYSNRRLALTYLSGVELYSGRYRDAIRHIRTAAQEGTSGQALGSYAYLSRVLAVSGDLSGSKTALNDAEDLLLQLETGSAARWARYSEYWILQVDRARASILDAGGHYAESEPLHRVAILRWKKIGHVFRELREEIGVIIYALLAENLIGQERTVEAEVAARVSLTRALDKLGRYSAHTGRALQTLVDVLIAQGRFAEAAKLAAATIEIYQKIGSPPDALQLLQSRRRRADARSAQRLWALAAAEYAEIEDRLAGDRELFEQAFGGNVNRPLAMLKSGRAGDSVAMARRIIERNRTALGAKHYRTAEARGVLAMALAANGDRRDALAEFRAALPVLIEESRSSGGAGTTRVARDQRLALIIESYIRLLAELRDAGHDAGLGIDAEAFKVAGVARARSVQRALMASAARAAARDPALADMVRREQDAALRIGALHGLLANVMAAPADQRPDAAVIADLRSRAGRLRAARVTLADEIERRFPDYAATMSPRPATIAEVRAALAPGEALIATYVSDDATFVWAVPKTGEIAFAVAPLGRRRIAAAVGDLRRALDPGAERLGDIPPFDVGLLHRLYNALLAPVAAGWKDADRLLVVADGALGQLPFSVLVTAPTKLQPGVAPLFSNYRAVPFLARTHAVTVLPSVSSLAILRRLPATRSVRGFAGFGDPLFSAAQAAAAAEPPSIQTAMVAGRGLLAVRGLPVKLRSAPDLGRVSSANLAKLPRLPDTASELRGIARALGADPARDVFIGRDATEGRVKSMTLSDYKVLAFATHGLVPGDLDGLTQPALALSSPAVVGGTDDGLLTMGEILGLRLDADWVVLSACNTAAGDGAGAEAVSGLGRAFFYAGTRALLVSNWPVETTSARALTTDLFRRQASDPSLSRAEALRNAMLALIDGRGATDAAGRTVFSYAHPIFWAPFSLVGDGGGRAAGS